MFKNLVSILCIIVILLHSTLARAEEIRILTSPAAQAMPLFVLKAKQQVLFPLSDDLQIKLIQAPPQKDWQATLDILQQKNADYGVFNVIRGAKAYINGISHLKLADSFLWGAPLILSKSTIKPSDWVSLKGKTGIVFETEESPLYILGQRLLIEQGFDPQNDIILESIPYTEIINTIRQGNTTPDFFIVPEPLATQILTQQEEEKWKVHYHPFADIVRSLNAFGLPLGGFWIINEKPYTNDLIYAFEQAIEYLNEPANRQEASQIISEGYKEQFGILINANAVESMLARNNLVLRVRDAEFIQKNLQDIWQAFNLSPDDDIFHRRFQYKLNTPPIFMSYLMPHVIGFAILYQDEIGISDATVKEAKEISKQTAPRIASLAEEVRQLELQIFEQSITRNKEKFEILLSQLKNARKEASLVQWDAVQKAYDRFFPEDMRAIEEFLKKNRLSITSAFGL